MPVNRNALIRYMTIDNCLKNRRRLWTLEDLIDACSEALYEYEGIDKGVSRRTVQMDIQVMRSEKLGYNAPIVIRERKYYTYEEPDYSITNIPLTDNDLNKLSEVVDILRQFKGFSHFEDLSGMVQRLEDKIHVSRTRERPIIDLEKNDFLQGLHWLEHIYKAIASRKKMRIVYQSFKARQAQNIDFHPALLKEFRNRWFVLGRKEKNSQMMLLALDRIQELQVLDEPAIQEEESYISNYFNHVVGVSVNQLEEPQEVVLFANHEAAPYLITKPLHHSQELVGKNAFGMTFRFRLQLNYELLREILGFGELIKVVSPARLREQVRNRHLNAFQLYDSELSDSRLTAVKHSLDDNGMHVLFPFFTQREINRVRGVLSKFHSISSPEQRKIAYADVATHIPQVLHTLRNENLSRLLDTLNPSYTLKRIHYIPRQARNPAGATWRQSDPDAGNQTERSGLILRIHLQGQYTEPAPILLLRGSHKTLLEEVQIKTITENVRAASYEVQEGGVLLMHPMLLRQGPLTGPGAPGNVLHLEYF